MEITTLQIIRKSSFTPAPWKNGGGVTYEAIRVPASGDPFSWRVSVAHIDASGPFSDFAAYNRKMVLLQGAGIELRFADGIRKTLGKVGDLVEFDGGLAAYCELTNGPCADLNLMVSKAMRVTVRVERVIEPVAFNASCNETMLVFAIDRRVTLAIDAGNTGTLDPWDLAVLSSCSGQVGTLEPHASALVFVATLEFVSGE
ncbi:MAG TPA: HutD family protein [Steroidobacteraceae bacterium]|nr:HutD family protein [Steroidobacteraceae bacterium]